METTEKRCTQRYPFSGKIWCDDHADVYTGSCNKILQSWGSYIWNGHDGAPLNFKAEATCCEYLYIVAWNNDSGQAGLLAEINGDITAYSNANWEVYAAGIDFDVSSPRPTKEVIEAQLKEAHCNDWKAVTVGQQNDGSNQPFPLVTQMPSQPNFIWYDSGNDTTSAYPPFSVPSPGFNHDEFLIFRLPMKSIFVKRCQNCPCTKCKCDCDCNDCHGCNKNAADDNQVLALRALDKETLITSGSGCTPPFQDDCERTFVKPGKEPQLCFHLHILDSPSDQIEEHDTEIFYLTVCNPYKDICFNGLRITKITLSPSVSADKVQIVPDRFICFDCLEPCCCATREFALISRCEGTAGKYKLCVEYCYESIEWKGSKEKGGEIKYKIEIVED